MLTIKKIHTAIWITLLLLCSAPLLTAQENTAQPNAYHEPDAQETALHQAVRNSDLATLEKLLTENTETLINTATPRGITPLILAAYKGKHDAVKLLLKHGADVHASDWMGNTALMGASMKGFTDIAELLLDNGAQINQRNSIGATPLMFSSLMGREATVKLLITRGADITAIDQRGFTAITLALHRGFTDVAALLKGEPSEK
jgi:uncharacterized protein